LEDSKWDPEEAVRLKEKALKSRSDGAEPLVHSKAVQEFYKEVWTFLRNLWRRVTHQDHEKRDSLKPEEKTWMSEMEPILRKINFTDVHKDNFRIRFQEILTGTRANLNQRPKNANKPNEVPRPSLSTHGMMPGRPGLPVPQFMNRQLPNPSMVRPGPPHLQTRPSLVHPSLSHGMPMPSPNSSPGMGPNRTNSLLQLQAMSITNSQKNCYRVLEELESFKKGNLGTPVPVMYQHTLDVMKGLLDQIRAANTQGVSDLFPKAWVDTFMEIQPQTIFSPEQMLTISSEIQVLLRMDSPQPAKRSSLMITPDMTFQPRKRSRVASDMGIPANSSSWDANAILALTCDLVDLQDMPSEQEQDRLFPELINFIRTAQETRLAQTVRPLSQQLSKFRPEQQAQLVDAWHMVGFSITLPETSKMGTPQRSSTMSNVSTNIGTNFSYHSRASAHSTTTISPGRDTVFTPPSSMPWNNSTQTTPRGRLSIFINQSESQSPSPSLSPGQGTSMADYAKAAASQPRRSFSGPSSVTH
jgi:hypothetical protein